MNLNILKEWLQETEVSIMFLTTALFNKYIDVFPELFQSVSKILFGGEKANVSKINIILNTPRKCEIIHVYGPTETTTFATFYKINEKLDVYPIGEPINGVYTYILDKNLNIAREGELYIGGEGVANGYINTSNVNSFVRVPDIDKNLLYKTGDWVKLNRLGLIEYIGRIDNQIKINGFRLEIEELTSILNSHNKIKDACIHVNSQKQLYAFYVGDSISEEDLRDYILKYIPAFMLPHSINKVQTFPLTSNNKIDTKKLYNDVTSKDSIQSEHLEDFDHILLTIFSNVLKIDKSNITLDSNFFRIGGTLFLRC
ncbi:AMP-binding protein [Staphylococcus saprophyticus]